MLVGRLDHCCLASQQLANWLAAREDRDGPALKILQGAARIDAEKLVNRRQEIFRRQQARTRGFSPAVGLSDDLSHAHAAAGNEHRHGTWVMTAARRAIVMVDERGTAELAGDDD